MSKKKIIQKNYLEKIPLPSEHIKWTDAEDGLITLEIENTGVFNRMAQKLFKKPKISYVHLDKMGSFLWLKLNGKDKIIKLGKQVEVEFGDEANPLYERLVKYFEILYSYNFITWVE